LILRVTPYNRYSWTPLLAALERADLAGEWEVIKAWDLEEVLASLEGPSPMVVAYSFMTFGLSRVARELETLVPRMSRGGVLVAGGPHPTGAPRAPVDMGFHHVFVGEWEEVFPGFLRGLMEGREFPSVLRAGG